MPARSPRPFAPPVADDLAADDVAEDVVAVLVAHDGARWLPEVLAALAASTLRPRALIAVDTGSTDASPDLLREARAAGTVTALVELPRDTGYGAAVAAGLRALEIDAPAWLWLLHDDAAPAPDCLAALREHGAASPSSALLGPKALDWHDPRVLVEVGITTDRAGHRETGLERGERDQGQHDAPRDVLAVGTAGALMRREVWDAVGGLAPELPLYRDELDLGWRVTASGSRVVVVPQAVVRHVRAATTARRTPGAAPGAPLVVDRRHALLVLLAHATLLRLLVALPALLLMQVLRVLGHLLTRSLTGARAEVLAPLQVLARPDRLLRMRRQRKALRTAPAGAVRPLLASRSVRLRARAEAAAALLAGQGSGPAVGPGVGPGVGPAVGPAVGLAAGLGDAVGSANLAGPRTGEGEPRLLRAVVQRPVVAVVLLLALLALLAERAVLSPGDGLLQGGRLLPPPDGASDLWAAYGSTWSSTGPGSPAPASPQLAVLATFSTLLLGKPWLVVDLVLLAGVPLAGLTAYAAARRLVTSRALRVWAALTWALLPAATGAVAVGRLDAAVVQVLLPLLGLGAVRALRDDPRGRWHRVWGLALGLALVTALAPTLWLVSALLLLGAAVAAVVGAAPAQRRPARRRAVAAAVVVAVPPVLLLPWSLEVLRTPGLLVHGPGRLAADPSLADAALPAWHLLGLSPGGAGLPPWWLGLGLTLPALAALLRRDRDNDVLRGWTVALTGLGLALLLARTGAGAPTGADDLPVWPGVPLQVAAAGLLVAALLGAAGVRERLARSAFGSRQVGAAVLAGAAVLLPVVAAASWVARGADEPLRRTAPLAVPAFVDAELDAEPGLRVLVLEPGDGATGYELVTGAGLRLGAADVAARPERQREVDGVVADLLTAQGGDAAAGLAARAVRYVVLPRSAADGAQARALDAAPGLLRRADDPALLWEVLAPTARLTVLGPDAAERARAGDSGPRPDDDVTPLPPAGARLPAGGQGRLLVLSEPVDPGWQGWLDGRDLAPVTAWQGLQGFELPADGGAVVAGRADPSRVPVPALQALGLAVVAVLAAPGAARRRGLEPAADPPADLAASAADPLADPAAAPDAPARGAR